MAGRVSLSPGPLDDQAAVPSGRGAGTAGAFYFSGLMPNRKRMAFVRFTSTSPIYSKLISSPDRMPRIIFRMLTSTQVHPGTEKNIEITPAPIAA
jgi:hypothetical protein